VSQESRLLLKPSLARIAHPWASLPVMDVLPNTIYASEVFLPISLPAVDLLENYVPCNSLLGVERAVVQEEGVLTIVRR